MKNIYIIILHIGNIAITRNCIDSLYRYEQQYAKIIVVNNDVSILKGEDFGRKSIIVLNNKKNLGFAAGVNVGIMHALKRKAGAVLLLNNDILIKKPFIKHIADIFVKYPSVGIVGPAICFEKNDNLVFDIGGEIDMRTGRTHHAEVHDVSALSIRLVRYITGAAMLIKKEVFEKIGLFDEHFFLYYEDADFCLRAKKGGFTIAVVPQASVYHLLSKTIGKVNAFAVYHQTRSLVIFGKKYMQTPLQKLLHIIFLLGQTSKITLKHPKAGLAGWKAIGVLQSMKL